MSQGIEGAGRSAHESGRKHHDAAQELQHAVDSKAYDPKRNQQDPHERIDDQRQ